MTKAATLPEFSPSLGYTYPSLETTKPKYNDADLRSKEATPMPDTQSSSKSHSTTTTTQTDDFINNQLLAETLNISSRYGDEYMDEVPVAGQPGEFRLSTKKQDASKLVVPTVVKTGGTPKPDGLSLKTDVPKVEERKKGEKSPKTPSGGMSKVKRRKSKSTGGSTAGSVASSS